MRRPQFSQASSSFTLIVVVISTCSLLLASRGVTAAPIRNNYVAISSRQLKLVDENDQVCKNESRTRRASFLSKTTISTTTNWRRRTLTPSVTNSAFVQPLSKQTPLAKRAITQPRHNDKSTSKTALHLKFKTFDEMLLHHHSAPILIDFYAPWCGPCKMMKGELTKIRERLEELGPPSQTKEEEDCDVVDDVVAVSAACIDGADSKNGTDAHVYKAGVKKEKDTAKPSNRSGGIPVYHVNTNKFPQVGAKNEIHGLPTLVLFYEGEELWRNEGIILGDDIMDVLVGLQEGGWKKKASTAA